MVERFINEDTVRRALRPDVLTLVDMFGLDRTMSLVEAIGGLPTYVPHTVTDDSAICQLVDRELAEVLARTCAGEYLKLPLSRKALVYWLHWKGWTAAKIAKKLRVEQRSVHRWIAAELVAQLDLFADPV